MIKFGRWEILDRLDIFKSNNTDFRGEIITSLREGCVDEQHPELKYSIETYSFGHDHKAIDFTGFSKDSSQFDNFVQGIKNCPSLWKSLKTIQINEVQLQKDTAVQILQTDLDISNKFLGGYSMPSI